VGIHVDHSDGALGRDRLKDRQGDRMVAPGAQGRYASGVQAAVEVGDVVEGALQVVDARKRHVAQVGDGAELVRVDPAHVMDRPHQARLVAHLARPVAGARPVGHPAVEGHADEADVDAGRVPGEGCPHEGGDFAIARRGHGVLDLGQFRPLVHVGLPLRFARRRAVHP
jgi:hypothetical protein